MKKSNTKLNEVEKKVLKNFVAGMGADTGFAVCGNVTALAKIAGPDTVRISTSVMSPDEKKHRPKVGMYVALTRMREGQYVTVPRYGASAKEVAEDFAIAYGC